MKQLTLCILCVIPCCQETIAPRQPSGVDSFSIKLQTIADYPRAAGCEKAPVFGTAECPRPFAESGHADIVTFSVTALRDGAALDSFAGTAMVDVRPGYIQNVDPAGVHLTFAAGVAQGSVNLAYAFGETRLWTEDCGSGQSPGTFATGVSEPLFYDLPELHQLNRTTDNTTSPMLPRPNNICAIGGDPRFGLGLNEDQKVELVGFSQGKAVNVPPPAMGTFVELRGCGAAEHRAAPNGGIDGCRRGPLVVTAVGNDGFYVSDINKRARATGFNHSFAFTFNYPDDLEVGDILVKLSGSPIEFAGTTQLGNPTWIKDPGGPYPDLIPLPTRIDPVLYASALRTYGRNEATHLALEKFEGAFVCFDNLAPSTTLTVCDQNDNGRIERDGCLLPDFDTPLPRRCGPEEKSELPDCANILSASYCLPLDDETVSLCGLRGYVPRNPAEYCCERICYNNFACSEESSYVGFGQWTADVTGNYDKVDTDPIKIAITSRDADPDFDPFEFGRTQKANPDRAARRTITVKGTLRQVLAARPVWLVVARHKDDIDQTGAPCPVATQE